MQKKLKVIRVIFAVLFFIPILFLFLDYRKLIPDDWFQVITHLQFLPSIIKALSILSISAFGFIIVIILTVLFGRIYCSTICPLGVLIDIIIRISNWFKNKKKRYFKYNKPLNILRYSILATCIVFLFFGYITILNWLDPYSVFGRISTYFFKPLIISINNILVEIFKSMGNYFFYHIEYKPFQVGVYIIPVIIFIAIIKLSVTKGRIYCNTICPVGSILGLISKVSFFKVSFDNSTCTSCSLCEKSCKAQCIDYKKLTVDSTRCIACFNCIPVCKSNSVKFNFSNYNFPRFLDQQNKNHLQHNDKRRKIITGSILYLISLAGFSMKSVNVDQNKKNGLIPVKSCETITPPGSLNREHFTTACTACSLCISACPTNVLQPSFLEYGFLGIMQPFMDFNSGFCNYDCKKCSEICPTGAIHHLSIDEKHITQIGIAKFIIVNCIVETNGTDCGACSEHCPTKAVHMVPYKDKLVIPEVTEEICIGCGACEHVCPAKPYKAIYVEGNNVHKLAKKPKIIQNNYTPIEEDFPF